MTLPGEYLKIYNSADEVPKLKLKFPRAITAIHQIEITSRCNLRCVYCPSKDLQRPKVDMDAQTFKRALEHVRYYRDLKSQVELNFAGIGESTLHPEFVDFVHLAREMLGPDMIFTMATNGVGYDESLVKAVAPARLHVWVSLHRPEKAAQAVEWWRKAERLIDVSTDPATNSNDWAGQVNWPRTSRAITQCMWLRYGFAMVMADGRVTTCCLDASGAGVVGHVDQPFGSMGLMPYKLCQTCHQVIGAEGHNQWPK